ncbi:MAG: tyrosine-type recombinase/integrase [Burkholderiales bacterium]
MVHRYFTRAATCARRRVGPLSPYVSSIADALSESGYARSTAADHLRLVGDLSQWLARRRLGAADLDERTSLEYLKHRRRRRVYSRGKSAILKLLVDHLRQQGVVGPRRLATPRFPGERLACDFEKYLTHERALAPATRINYLPFVRGFLGERLGRRAVRPQNLTARNIHRFMLRLAPKLSPGRAKLMVTALRSFFRFLLLRGDVRVDWAACVPPVANWRLAELPKSMEPADVERLLQGCNQRAITGQRDYTILLLLARLGLRACEIVALTLDDIDWEAGEILVRGKGSQQDRLPLPQDVGQAVASYLRAGRPRCASRHVFIRRQAPRRGFAGSMTVCTIVARALARAGLSPARKGAHLLRHSLAVRMLRRGASLAQIGQILRHRLPQSTEIYAKVDLDALRSLAQPWPGGGR